MDTLARLTKHSYANEMFQHEKTDLPQNLHATSVNADCFIIWIEVGHLKVTYLRPTFFFLHFEGEIRNVGNIN